MNFSWIIAIVLLIITRIVYSIHHHGSSNQSFSMDVELNDYKILMSWKVDWALNVVEIKIESNVARNDDKWVLVGFADHHDIYANTDFCIFVNDQLWDGWIELNKNSFLLHNDFHQDCELVSSNAGSTIGFTFTRRFLTCDARDYAIEPGTTNFVFAVGSGKPRTLNDSSVVFDMKYNQLLQRNLPAWPIEMQDTDSLVIKANNAHVPSEVTTYWCVTVKLDEILQADKHHIIQIEALITPGNEFLVHHMEIFHCPEPIEATYNGNCDYKSESAHLRTCSRVIAAWAMGAGPIVYPPEAGLPFGGPDFNPWVMVEIHYNNVEKKSGIIDESGFRLTYTKNLRPNDAAIMELGLIYSDANSIPPGRSNWAMTGECVADCTNKFPKEGITIFASQLHSHLTGRKLWTSHYRDGVKIGEINRDNHFSPHWQVIRRFQGLKKVLPGDVLSTTCVYETLDKKNWTWGGYGIEDEMCVNYIYYYPASEVEVCKSAVDNSTLHKFFSAFGVKNPKLKIHEKYLTVKWSERRYKFLNELYTSGNLNMHCLNHAGDLFPGHRTNWTNIPRPETFAGVYTKDRALFECPSIND